MEKKAWKLAALLTGLRHAVRLERERRRRERGETGEGAGEGEKSGNEGRD